MVRNRANIVLSIRTNEPVIHAKSAANLDHTQFHRLGSRVTRNSTQKVNPLKYEIVRYVVYNIRLTISALK